MEYSHSRKAGNIGDVWKHFALSRILERAQGKRHEYYIETHAGAGLYELVEKYKKSEWGKGIDKVITRKEFQKEPFIRKVLWKVNPHSVFPGLYPGSAYIAKTFLPRSNLLLFENSTPIKEILKKNVQGANVRVGDGFEGLITLNKRELGRKSVIFIDPPYVNGGKEDWKKILEYVTNSRYLGNPLIIIWYPIFAYKKQPHILRKRCESLGIAIWVIECVSRKPELKPSQVLKGSGMIVINDSDKTLFNELVLLAKRLAKTMKNSNDPPEVRNFFAGHIH